MGGCDGEAVAGAAGTAGVAGAAEDIVVVELVVVLSFELCEALSCAKAFRGIG